MQTIPLYRVQLALGIAADRLSKTPSCRWHDSLNHLCYAISKKWMPIRSSQRQVLLDGTIHFEGLNYPAPGFLPRQIVWVEPVSGTDFLAIQADPEQLAA